MKHSKSIAGGATEVLVPENLAAAGGTRNVVQIHLMADADGAFIFNDGDGVEVFRITVYAANTGGGRQILDATSEPWFSVPADSEISIFNGSNGAAYVHLYTRLVGQSLK